ncbi:hypothetical protein A2856_03895 [Candidatus Uhrbacteria bacterium RIFCSPHIGHO2_01_FULL_63_20]|uniref:Uncharacterized protein n=1 Tax=Candidatus Uhrbacteria bacterium RIFCSPHIGHO2_01_FULL_63_20 TaxID=1802385 RepID=A0A1F7TMF9_9BACT|nr:MAG: hypothetical protein A2856_03895 [Candidatus Uhrbacteria bacterium RIFCSPHIGHO2_01_FULL_63_20]
MLASGVKKGARHMARLATLRKGDWDQFDRLLNGSDLTAEEVLKLLEHPDVLDDMLKAMRKHATFRTDLDDHNPFALTASELLTRLRLANKEEGWGLGEEVFDRLAKTAPEQPKGRLAFLSLRIRLGKGQEGVANTFEAHAERIEKEFGESAFYRWEHLRSDKDRLRLLAGNDTHKSVVEWVTIDLGANRKRKSIEAVRGKLSLADEGLAFAWLHPEYVKAIDYDENPGFFLAGYELNVPEHDGRSWYGVPCVYRNTNAGGVFLDAGRYGFDYREFLVPSLGSDVL